MLALVDCNNFYASCERIFEPKLIGHPVIVLSNNDGCVVARSNEAKALGIFMAQPYFEIKELCNKHNVKVFSANFPLYGDISGRIVATLKNFTNNLEVYSIDESFLDADIWPQESKQLVDFGKELKQTVQKNVGVPVSVGLAKTKTRAKIANLIAKKHSKSGVFNLEAQEPHMQERIFKTLDVADVWGIGRATTVLLSSKKIKTVWDFLQLPDEFVKKNLSIKGLQTKQELLGFSVWPVGQSEAATKSISSTRTFGVEVQDFATLQKAITSFAQIACQKLRRDKLTCNKVSVFIASNRFKNPLSRYSAALTQTLPQTSYATQTITANLVQALQQIYKPGITYKRAGVTLTQLQSKKFAQLSLIEDNIKNQKQQLTSLAQDKINAKWGSNALTLASGFLLSHKKVTDMRGKLSPQYTTSWDEIKKVK